MSWRDTLKGNSDGAPLRGSFRGAWFVVPESSLEFGRRAEVHEYPLRDIPYVEDLGRKARRFAIEVFVAGPDYLIARDALIAAVEQPGPGQLVHPWYGTMQVSIVEARVRETTREGGRASFSLTCVESGALQFPTVTADTAAQVVRAADAVDPSMLEAFLADWNPDNLPGWAVVELVEDVTRQLALVEKVVGTVAGDIAALIRSPANLYAAIAGGIRRIATTAAEPLRAVKLYQSLFNGASRPRPVPAALTPTRRTVLVSQTAMASLIAHAAAVEACRAASQASLPTRDEALVLAAALADMLDARMEAVSPVTGRPLPDDLYQVTAALRAAVVVDMRERAAMLPRLRQVPIQAVLPALVLAHRIHGDAAHAAEIIERNGVRHPGFVPAGMLEVIDA